MCTDEHMDSLFIYLNNFGEYITLTHYALAKALGMIWLDSAFVTVS
jgi:hypothetical protein